MQKIEKGILKITKKMFFPLAESRVGVLLKTKCDKVQRKHT